MDARNTDEQRLEIVQTAENDKNNNNNNNNNIIQLKNSCLWQVEADRANYALFP